MSIIFLSYLNFQAYGLSEFKRKKSVTRILWVN